MDIASQVERLRQTFAGGRTKPLAWRLRQLEAIERLLAEKERDLVDALAADLGREGFEAWFADLAPTRAESVYARKNLRKWAKPKHTGIPLALRPGRAWYQYEPLGVTLVIGPWNYPVYLTLGPAIAALAAGNCLVIKPSEHAPATAALLARIVPEYLDKDAVIVVEGGPDETQQLLDEALDHVLFTGGPEIGKAILAGAAKHLTPVTLELGGKCPVIVTAETDVEVAARRIAFTKYLNSGQTCIAPDYVLADRKIADRLATSVAKAVDGFAGDGGRSRQIVNERHASRLAGLLKDHGGEVVHGGGSDTGHVDFTIVTDPLPSSPLMTEEIFGPILPILKTDSLAEAIGFVQARPKPLAAYLFSPSKTDHRRFLADISAGGAVINHIAYHVLAPELPFGGVGNSGMGAYHGEWGFHTFSHRKAVLKRPTTPDPKFAYPPYSETAQKLFRRLM